MLIALLAGYELYRRWQQLRSGDEATREYYKVSRGQRLLVGAVYFGLVALLVMGMDATHVARTFADT